MLFSFFQKISKYFHQSYIGKIYFGFRDYIQQINPYFSVQFLFAWAIFKLAFFFKFNLLFRLLLGFFFLLILIFFWEKILPFILNSFLFQLWVFSFFILVNLSKSFSIPFGFIGFFLGSLAFFWVDKNHFFRVGESTFFIPDWEYFLFLLICFTFFRRFASTVVIPSIKKGISYESRKTGHLQWETLVVFINSYFEGKFTIKNKLSLHLFSYPFSFFPVEKKFLDILGLHLNETENLIKGLMVECVKKTSPSDENLSKIVNDLSIYFVKEYNKIIDKSQKVIFEIFLSSFEQNNLIYFEILQGLIISYFLFFLVVNLF
jgi:hypothetical protein